MWIFYFPDACVVIAIQAVATVSRVLFAGSQGAEGGGKGGEEMMCPKCGAKMKLSNEYFGLDVPLYFYYECPKCGEVCQYEVVPH